VTGPEHYRQAETILAAVSGRNLPSTQAMANVAAAHVHAELATAAATALVLASRSLPPGAVQEWADVLSQPAQGAQRASQDG
jgi:hypothetical protein